MTYKKLATELLTAGFERVERDDRLLDVLPKETREKGIELWQYWNDKTVELVRILLPYDIRKIVYQYTLPRREIEHTLLENGTLQINSYKETPYDKSHEESVRT